MISKAECNKKLIGTYGLTLEGLPKFRVVWSNDETEKRKGEYEIYYGEIFVRKETGIREWKKYEYLEDKWVLEQIEYTDNPELLDKISYEPIWVFMDKNGDYLPLNWDVCEIVINSILNRQQKEEWTDKRIEEEKAKIHAANVKRNVDFLTSIGESEEVKKARLGSVVYNAKDSVH